MREAGCSIKEQNALMSNLKRAKTNEAQWSVMRQIEAAIERAQSKRGPDFSDG
jgi:hypothetical protein